MRASALADTDKTCFFLTQTIVFDLDGERMIGRCDSGTIRVRDTYTVYRCTGETNKR